MDDINLVDALTDLFRENYTGNENAVKTGSLVAKLAKLGIITSGREIREAMGNIRQMDMLEPGFIVSDVNDGYWLSYDAAEQDSFLDKQLNRMSNQFKNVKALHQRIRYGKKSGPEIQATLF